MNLTMFICGAVVGGVSYLVLRNGKKKSNNDVYERLKEEEALAKNKRRVQRLEHTVRKHKNK